MNDFSAYECEVRYYKRLENISKFIIDKKNYFSILFSDTLRWLPPPLLAGSSKSASVLLFPLDFRAFSAFVAIQNV